MDEEREWDVVKEGNMNGEGMGDGDVDEEGNA